MLLQAPQLMPEYRSSKEEQAVGLSHQAAEVFEQGTRCAARWSLFSCCAFQFTASSLFRERRNLPRWGYARISRCRIKKDGRPKLLAYVAGTFTVFPLY